MRQRAAKKDPRRRNAKTLPAEVVVAVPGEPEPTPLEVLAELAIILRSDIRNFRVDDEGRLLLAEGVPQSAGRAVASLKRKVSTWGEDGRAVETEIRLWDKVSAAELIGKYFAMWISTLNLKDPDEIIARLLGIGRDQLPAPTEIAG